MIIIFVIIVNYTLYIVKLFPISKRNGNNNWNLKTINIDQMCFLKTIEINYDRF